MSRVLKRLAGSGGGGAFADGDLFKLTPHVTPLKDNLDLLLLGVIQRNVFIGGSDVLGVDGSATGDVQLPNCLPLQVDNSSNQITGFSDANGATLVVRMRFLVRVSNAGISVTPKVLHGTDGLTFGSTATISGAAACSATASDYSGSNQAQTIALTLPSGVKYFRPVLTIAGTPAAGYQVWGRVIYDCFIQN